MTTGSRRRRARRWIVLAVTSGVLAGGIFAAPYFEWRSPRASVGLEGDAVGLRPFTITFTDDGRGLEEAAVTLEAGAATLELFRKRFGAGVREQVVRLEPGRWRGRVPEGEAVLRITARDRSYWNWLRGNTLRLERRVRIDLTAPRIEVLSRQHYVNFGGTGFIVYRAAADAVRSGVAIGDHFFPGTKGRFSDPNVYVAFFAHPYDTEPSARPVVLAEDAAGNVRRMAFSYRLKPRRYRRRTLVISDRFIDEKVLPLAGSHSDRLSAFLWVNRELRARNAAEIRRIAAQSADRPLWEGAFRQLPNSKVEAFFADDRTYVYKGRVVDRQYHLGYDLAVTRRYPVEAANRGIVRFAGDLGIYGHAVIVDHGLGIATLYAHLSSIAVAVGEEVDKGAVIGRSGETGLAGGDHLHYGVLVHGVPVLPLEWWDARWIRDNVLGKLEAVTAELGMDTAG